MFFIFWSALNAVSAGWAITKNLSGKLWQEEAHQDPVEFPLLVVLVAIFAIVAMSRLAGAIGEPFPVM